VQVFDFGVTDEGQPYLVMERLEGETLARRLRREKRIPIPTTVHFLSQVSRALERAHALGIVHRDLKLHNIVIVLDEDQAESVKVVDFGIAKLLRELHDDAPAGEHEEPPEDEPISAETLGSFTRTGSILGTPNYMAPEQIVNAPDLDGRADIWAFGVVAFECLTGEVPFVGSTLLDLFVRVRQGEHRRARDVNPALPPAFDEWFDRACAVDRDKRFANARTAATELAIALGERPSAASPASRTSFSDVSGVTGPLGPTSSPSGSAATPTGAPAASASGASLVGAS
jgi:serine/threonine-protein kinase